MTNEEIGKLIGLSHSAVSRLRRGERLPSIQVMLNVQDVFGWAITDQIWVRSYAGAGGYGQAFNDELDAYVYRTTRPPEVLDTKTKA
jgi:transcriptional regulator with XRE-family HTH domain